MDGIKSLSIEKVAALLGTSRRTVYREIADGQLTAYKIRGSLRILESSVRDYQRKRILEYQLQND